jgi:hypothetical protein
LENRTDNIIHLQLPDVGLDRSWHLDDLPQPLPYEAGKDGKSHGRNARIATKKRMHMN